MIITTTFDKDKLFFTADTHFFHKNINVYCNRPYKTNDQMNEQLVKNWNSVVPKDGIVFLAGDFALTSCPNKIKEILNALNGTIYLILGNHDYQYKYYEQNISDLFSGRVMDTAYFSIIDKELEHEKVNFFISHYPHLSWPTRSFHLHGHTHYSHNGKFNGREVLYSMYRYDIGVDGNKYKPISYENLKIMFTKRLLHDQQLSANTRFTGVR